MKSWIPVLLSCGAAIAQQPAEKIAFEVASIKTAQPSPMGQIRVQMGSDNGMLRYTNVSLKDCIRTAFRVKDFQVDGPEWLDSARFDITAKAPAGPGGSEVDFEDLRLMLRALLLDRFELKTHLEERPVDGYVLSAVKPKLQKADPSNRTGCKEGPGPDGKDPRIANPILSRLLTCQNMTMAQFADQLPNLANGYAHVQVLDATGLADAYDFTISFSAVGLLRGLPGQPPPAPGANAASDPSGAVSLPEAVSKQLGLKLELKKRPMQVLVVDHINEKPTDN